MTYSTTQQALARLRTAADTTQAAWPPMRWDRVAGPGPDSLMLVKGAFKGLALEPGQDLTLRSRLNIPHEAAGVPLAGDPLEMTIFSLYPIDLSWNGQQIFEDSGVPVAAGPALIQVLPQLAEGENGDLEVRVRVPNHQMTSWVFLRFTTPGLRARFELLDVAWSQLALANTVAVTPEERAIVERAAALVPETLVSADLPALQDALHALERELAPLAERIAAINVHVIGHSHIDMNWLWTWNDTLEVIRRDFRSILALMHDYPEMTFTHSQPATYEVIRQHEPALFERIREHVQTGRWEPATMTWVEGDTNMASGEGHAHQLLEGVTFSREQLDASPATFLAPDTFGHAGNLPQLVASAGATRYYHHRANPGNPENWPAYWWEGQDGTRILAISTHTYNGDIRARDLAEAAIRAYRHGHPSGLHFHGIGDHGGGPARQNMEALRRFQNSSGLPTARCSTLAAYTKQILDSGVALPTHRGESSTIFEGCYTTHGDTKRYNRHGENLLCTAETLAVLVNQDQREPLRQAWRAVLFNQFHDILDGSAIHEAYEKNADDFAEVAATAKDVADQALGILERGLRPGSIAVTNPLGWEREEWVLLHGQHAEKPVLLVGEHGHQTIGQPVPEGLGFVARVPAFGTVSYYPHPETPELEQTIQATPAFSPYDPREDNVLAAAETTPPYLLIETPHFRTYLRRDSGILVSFVDKRIGRELVAYGMRRKSDYQDSARADLALNVLQLAEEHPHRMSSWHLDEVYNERSLLRGATSEVIESGPARLVVEVRHTLRSSSIVQRISFYRDMARVDFDTSIDWQELGSEEVGIPNLKAAFTVRTLDCEAWFETPFGAARRPADGQEVPALRWADVGGQDYGFAIINDSKYGHDALGNRLRLTLVRSGYEPDAISDIGRHEIRYAFLPHSGDWRTAGVVQAAAGFNQPLLARVVSPGESHDPQPVWRPTLAGLPSAVISGLKCSHDGSGMIVRLYESAGRAGEVELAGLPANARAWETTIIEDRLRELTYRGGSLRLALRPWQVVTMLIVE